MAAFPHSRVSDGADVRISWSIFLFSLTLYASLAWLICGGGNWWVIDYIDGQNVFFGDDAYRFFLSRSAWVNSDLYTYNFVLPGQLFLDGLITYLVQGDLFLSRCIHAVIGATGLSLIYLISRNVGLGRSVSVAAVLILGLLPRYALMNLSFYGEVWLGFFLIFSLYLYLEKRYVAMSIVGAWLPLLRPEGIFFLAPLCVAMLKERRIDAFFILLFPGTLYFFYLVFSLPSLTDYNFWRLELRTILKKIDTLAGKWEIFNTYSFWLTVPAVIAIFLKASRLMWPFWVGGIIWIAWFQGSVFLGVADFEKRYSYILLPLTVILWGIMLESFFSEFREKGISGKILTPGVKLVPAILSLLIMFQHFLKTDNIRLEVQSNGYKSLAEKLWGGRWSELYGYYPQETISSREEMAGIIHKLLEKDEGIDKLAIYTAFLYYHIDPYKIPSDVTVGFLTNGYMVFNILLDGQSFIQHPGGTMYSYLEYGEPDFGEDENRVLVATIMPLVGYPYTWKRSTYELYLFSYLESKEAKVDVSTRPDITPEMIKKAYEPWYGKY